MTPSSTLGQPETQRFACSCCTLHRPTLPTGGGRRPYCGRSRELIRAQHRLTHLLMRQRHVYAGGEAWTQRHDRWLKTVRFDQLTRPQLAQPEQRDTRVAFDDAHDPVLATLARRGWLDREIAVLATDPEFAPLVTRLCCLRGVSTLTGLALAVEIGDWEDRFTSSSIGSFVQLVPSE